MKPTKILLAVALITLSLGLLAAETSHSSPIVIKPLANGDWQVEYRLKYPVEGLQFMRTAGFLREDNWQVTTPGYHFIRSDEGQVLTLEEGAEPARTVRIVFPVDTRFILRDYELFNAFTDGSLALYTGHFYARPLGKQVPEAQSQGFLTEVEIAPPKGKKVGLRGELSSQPLSWIDSTGQGTYIYIGNTQPITADGVIAIFDRGLPGWVAAQAKERIPELLTYYRQRMGKHSDLPTLVLFSYEAEAQNRYGYNGGARENLIQMRVQGPGWQQETAGPMRSLVHFFAHEAAHLWNGQAARHAEGAPSWMHEGSADAMAERAMLELGFMSEGDYWRYQVDALNACHMGLAGTVLNTTREHRLNYECGNVLALWSEMALKAANSEQNLFDIWRRLIKSESGGSYDQSDYFDILEQMGVEERQIAAMRNFVGQAHSQPLEFFAVEAAKLGVALKRDDNEASKSAGLRAGGRLVYALLGADCRKHGFYTQGDHLLLAGLEGCNAAQNGMQIDRLEDTPLTTVGYGAYHQAVVACAETGEVKVGNDRGMIALPCPDALPPLPGWWVLGSKLVE